MGDSRGWQRVGDAQVGRYSGRRKQGGCKAVSVNKEGEEEGSWWGEAARREGYDHKLVRGAGQEGRLRS